MARLNFRGKKTRALGAAPPSLRRRLRHIIAVIIVVIIVVVIITEMLYDRTARNDHLGKKKIAITRR